VEQESAEVESVKFIDDYVKARKDKNSVLCLGLDPALPDQRSKQTIHKIYCGDVSDCIQQFSMEMIEAAGDYACAVKINSQYTLFALNFKRMQALTESIHNYGMLAILDHKLGDIGQSNDSALYWMQKCHFDAVTFSPYAGNIREATEMAHERDIGIFVLDLMSNPEAEGFQKKCRFNKTPVYLRVAEEVKSAGSDGVVVGSTGHVREKDITEIRRTIGPEKIMLFPGVGAQGGDMAKVKQTGGKNILINVGRDIIYDKNPREKIIEYYEKLKKI
jgi:orotidine 5'-phosphate decarboxylase subfamily 2